MITAAGHRGTNCHGVKEMFAATVSLCVRTGVSNIISFPAAICETLTANYRVDSRYRKFRKDREILERTEATYKIL